MEPPSVVPLNALHVIYSGYVEKCHPQRNSVFRRRYLVLTGECIHWFQRDEFSNEFVGDERGRILLQNLVSIENVEDSDLGFEIRSVDLSNVKHPVRRVFNCVSKNERDEWVRRIQQTSLKNGTQLAIAPDTNPTEGGEVKPNHSQLKLPLDQITVVSIRNRKFPQQQKFRSSNSISAEVITSRNPDWNTWLTMTDVRIEDEFVFTISSGQYGVVPAETLILNSQRGESTEITMPVLESAADLDLLSGKYASAEGSGAEARKDREGPRRGARSLVLQVGRPREDASPERDRRTSSVISCSPFRPSSQSDAGVRPVCEYDCMRVVLSALTLVSLGLTLFIGAKSGATGQLQAILKGPYMLTLVLSTLLALACIGKVLLRRGKPEKTYSFSLRCRCEDSRGEGNNSKESSEGYTTASSENHHVSSHPHPHQHGFQSNVDDNVIPHRYLLACDYDVEEAQRRWDLTRTWRATERIDGILYEPQPLYKVIKELYPHYVCGRSKKGHVIYWERPGHIPTAQMRAAGISPDMLARHWVFTTEFQWQVTVPAPDAKSISVIDLDGVTLSMITTQDIVDSLGKIVTISNLHYPERSVAVYIVNAPSWYSFCWRLVKQLVSEKTQMKIRILRKKETLAGLMEHIDLEEIPVYYGGRKDFGDIDSCRFLSPDEIELNEWVEKVNNGQVTMADYERDKCPLITLGISRDGMGVQPRNHSHNHDRSAAGGNYRSTHSDTDTTVEGTDGGKFVKISTLDSKATPQLLKRLSRVDREYESTSELQSPMVSPSVSQSFSQSRSQDRDDISVSTISMDPSLLTSEKSGTGGSAIGRSRSNGRSEKSGRIGSMGGNLLRRLRTNVY